MSKSITHGWTTAQPDNPDKDVSADELNDHTEVYAGLTAGQVLRASAADAADFASLQDGDIPSTIARDSEVTAVAEDIEEIQGELGLVPSGVHATVQARFEAIESNIVTVESWASRATAFVVAASDAPQAWLDAADYVCDGTADEAQINAALAALPTAVVTGGRVVLSDGHFAAADSIVRPSGSHLQGQGDSTWITLVDNANVAVIINEVGAIDIGLSDLQIDGNRSANTSADHAGVAVDGVTGFRISGVRVKDPRGYGISINASVDGSVRDCRASGAGNDNFLVFEGSSDILFSDCHGFGAVGDLSGSPNATGFEVGDDSFDIFFANCHAYDNAQDGFGINNHTGTTGPSDITIANCHARDNGQHGFDVFGQAVDGPSGIIMVACISHGNTLDGFDVRVTGAGVTGVAELSGCVSSANGRFGYQLLGSDDITLGTCTAIANINHGFITQTSADRAVLTGCRSIANGGTGYYLTSDDATLSGCTARANTGAVGAASGSGFEIRGTGISLSACRAMDHANATTGRGFYVLAVDAELTGCVSTGNARDGLLISASHVGVLGGRYNSNGLNGVRSTAGSDFLRLIGVKATGNTGTPQVSLHSDGVNNIVEADASLAPTHNHDSDYEAAGGIATHSADTSSVHGITDTSALVVDGDTAGGELDGTYPNPTIDASHSGSTHAATQAAAEATASGALSTHAGAADPHTGYLKETERPIDLHVGSIPIWSPNVAGVVFTIANGAFMVAFQVHRAVTVSTAYFRVAVASGNMDVGIYDAAGGRLGSTGSFAVPTAAISVSRALTGSVALSPGVLYYAAIACDNTTASFGAFNAAGTTTIPGYNVRGATGSSMPLPATITTPTSNTGIAYGIWFA